DDGAAPDRKALLDGPDLLAGLDVPGAELATMAAWARLHQHVRADIRRAGDVADLGLDEIHAEIVVREVEKPGRVRESRRLPVLGARGSGADVGHLLVRLRPLFFVVE